MTEQTPSVPEVLVQQIGYVGVMDFVELIVAAGIEVTADDITNEVTAMYLEQVVLDPASFEFHFDWVKRQTEAVSVARLEDYDLDQLRLEGLRRCSVGKLTELVLSPVSLAQLRKCVASSPSPAWEGAIELMERRVSAAFGQKRHLHSTRPWEGQVTVSPLRVYRLFARRKAQAQHAIMGLRELSDYEFSELVDSIKGIQAKLRKATPAQFKKLDVSFHKLIISFSGIEIDESLVDLIIDHGDAGQLSAVVRQLVWLEHEAIVRSLEHRDFASALRSYSEHLVNSLDRWMPGVLHEIDEQNRSFYSNLATGDVLCVSSLNVWPLEFVNVGLCNAVAEAVMNGANFVYVHPSLSLIQSMNERYGISIDISPEDYEETIVEFRESLCEYLENRGVNAEDAATLIQSQCAHVKIDDERVFLLTNPDSTIGWFAGKDHTVLTRREVLGDHVASLEIQNELPGSNMENMFCRLLSEELSNHAVDHGQAIEVLLVALKERETLHAGAA